MGTKFFEKYPEYKIIEKPSAEVINKYKNMLPDDLIDFWKEYGFGLFMNGYFKIIDPAIYQEAFNYGYENVFNGVVFAVTGLGDFIIWDIGCVRFVNFRHGEDLFIQGNGDIGSFLNRVADERFDEEAKYANYFLAREQYGEPLFDECFGYFPILGMGGPEKVENMKKIKITEYIHLIMDTMRMED